MAAVITFLSDYGLDDDFVGVCHGVIARIAPDARVIDVTHGIERHDVRSRRARAAPRAALLPARRAPRGRRSRGRAASAGRSRCAPRRRTASSSARTTACSRWPSSASAARWRPSTSARSQHRLEPIVGDLPRARPLRAGGRAPRGRRAAGRAGDPIEPDELTPLHDAARPPRRRRRPRGPRARLRPLRQRHARRRARGAGRLRAASSATGSPINDELAHYATTFADVPPGELLLYEDAYRTLALAVNRGSAALHLGLDLDAEVRIRPA